MQSTSLSTYRTDENGNQRNQRDPITAHKRLHRPRIPRNSRRPVRRIKQHISLGCTCSSGGHIGSEGFNVVRARVLRWFRCRCRDGRHECRCRDDRFRAWNPMKRNGVSASFFLTVALFPSTHHPPNPAPTATPPSDHSPRHTNSAYTPCTRPRPTHSRHSAHHSSSPACYKYCLHNRNILTGPGRHTGALRLGCGRRRTCCWYRRRRSARWVGLT
jgi:hypothetical protein